MAARPLCVFNDSCCKSHALSFCILRFSADGPQHKLALSGCRTVETVLEAGATWRLLARSRQAQTLSHTTFHSPAYYDVLFNACTLSSSVTQNNGAGFYC